MCIDVLNTGLYGFSGLVWEIFKVDVAPGAYMRIHTPIKTRFIMLSDIENMVYYMPNFQVPESAWLKQPPRNQAIYIVECGEQ